MDETEEEYPLATPSEPIESAMDTQDDQSETSAENLSTAAAAAAVASAAQPSSNEQDLNIQKECLDLFSSTDYIMEPTIFDTIKIYFMHGGEPGPVVDLLSDNYTAVAQTVNLLAEWLIISGIPVQDVQLMVENHLRNLIMKHFDPKKADNIFNLEGVVPAWMTEMIEHSIWRQMLYKLAEDHPNCLMLNFTIKVSSECTDHSLTNLARFHIYLISVDQWFRIRKRDQQCGRGFAASGSLCQSTQDRYHQVCGGEHWNAAKESQTDHCNSTAQAEVDVRSSNHVSVFCYCFKDLAMRSEQTYVYSQMLLNSLYDKNRHGDSEDGFFIAKRVSQEIELAAREK